MLWCHPPGCSEERSFIRCVRELAVGGNVPHLNRKKQTTNTKQRMTYIVYYISCLSACSNLTGPPCLKTPQYWAILRGFLVSYELGDFSFEKRRNKPIEGISRPSERCARASEERARTSEDGRGRARNSDESSEDDRGTSEDERGRTRISTNRLRPPKSPSIGPSPHITQNALKWPELPNHRSKSLWEDPDPLKTPKFAQTMTKSPWIGPDPTNHPKLSQLAQIALKSPKSISSNWPRSYQNTQDHAQNPLKIVHIGATQILFVQGQILMKTHIVNADWFCEVGTYFQKNAHVGPPTWNHWTCSVGFVHVCLTFCQWDNVSTRLGGHMGGWYHLTTCGNFGRLTQILRHWKMLWVTWQNGAIRTTWQWFANN